MKQVRRDFHAADLSEQERAMLEFVGGLTLDSKSLRERDVQRLREVGFDDLQILEIVQLFSYKVTAGLAGHRVGDCGLVLSTLLQGPRLAGRAVTLYVNSCHSLRKGG